MECLLITNHEVDINYVFFAASWGDQHLTEWINPESIRATEVILGMKWDKKGEVWSAACLVSCLFPAEVEPVMAEKLSRVRYLKCCRETWFFMAKEARGEVGRRKTII